MEKIREKGFTLIELLVVVAIIGILASVVLASLSSARTKARDARRLSDMKQLQTALALYLNQNGQYPNSDNQGCGGYDTPGDGDFISALTSSGFMNSDITDPNSNSSCGNYRYYRYPAGYESCDPNRGAFYVLEIVATESSNKPVSPGWSCPTRNWQGASNWVTGSFEN